MYEPLSLRADAPNDADGVPRPAWAWLTRVSKAQKLGRKEDERA